ncbi:alginate export family protein [Methylomonas sp. AM2-LC]|uniref:alginate export family protein n=1 Tax=Methylomonas sp. AM2-LC TaxID=3153301 RepID=UPI0032663814
MPNKLLNKTNICPLVVFSVYMGLFSCISSTTFAEGNTPINPQPTPPPAYSRLPMTTWGSQMNDALLGNKKYEAPVWNLHNFLDLPDWLELNVDQRTRYEDMNNQFKASALGGDQQIALQTDLWLAAHLGKFTFATEFMDSRGIGGSYGPGNNLNNLNNNAIDTLDFVQAYVAWADKNVLSSHLGAEIKVGRQTLDLGSRRLIARPYYRNAYNSFTGIRLRVLDNAKWQLNSFFTLPVNRWPSAAGGINDSISQHVQQFDQEATRTFFSGGILEAYNLATTKVNAELYLYNLDEGDSFNNPTRKRRYFTPGLRFYIKPSKGNFDFQAEGMAQYGTVRATTTSTTDLRHEAYSSHLEAGYTLDMAWTPRFSMEYDYATGSKNKNGPSDERFDPLFGVSPVDFGPSGIFAPISRSNINSPSYRFSVSPRSDLLLSVQQRLVWLASSSDCWGAASCSGAQLNLNPSAKSGSYVGDLLGFTARYDFNSSWNLETGWYRLFKGQFAKTAQNAPSGGDVDYFYVQSLFRF